jgi:hypothetical protein
MGKSHARASMRLGPENRLSIRREWIAMRMNESIDAARKALQPTAFDHAGQGSPADAGFGRGPSRHEAFMLGRELQEGVQVALGHGQNVTIIVTF